MLRESFSFSDTLRDVVETYEVIAKQNDIRMEYALAGEISYSGSKAEVQQLMGILLDNACKYCPNGGVIRIIAKQSFHGVKLCVSNTATPISKKDTEMLTQRFHRGENATGKTGFGLGLSIAEAIANRHNGQLTVSTTTKDVFFVEAVLNSKQYHITLYVFGLLTVLGTILGRLICCFLCPFGLVQDLLHKIPFPKKIRKLPGEKYWRRLRFVLLGVFVILLPMLVHNLLGIGDPWFCKYICPVGTLEAGIPLVLLNPELQGAIGWHYVWKIAILVLILMSSVIIYRPFCRYLCPLGAIYGFFNRFAIYRYHIDTEKCVECGVCQKACKLDIPVWKKPNSIDCIRCGECRHACPTDAIQVRPPAN